MEHRLEIFSRLASIAAALIGLVVVAGWVFDVPGLYPSHPATVLFLLSMIVLFGLAVLLSFRKLGWAEAARQQAEVKLHQSEERSHTVFEQAAVGMGRVRFTDGRWIEVNEALAQMLGYSRQEMCATPWPQMTHPEDVDLDLAPFQRMAAGELERYTVEKRFIHQQGHLVWARLTLSLVRDEQGRPDYEIAIVEDITERHHALEALRQSERKERQRADELAAAVRSREEAMAQLNALLANAPLGFAFFDRQHRYVRLNEFLARQINGLPLEAHLGRPIREVLPVNAQAVDPLLDLVFSSGAPLENVVVTGETPAAPGEHRDWLTGWFPVRTPDGQIPWVGAVVVEITAQRRTQAMLQRQNRRLQLLQQAAAELLRAREPAGILRGLHPRLAQDFGLDVFMLYGPGKEGQQFELQACGGMSPEQVQQLEGLRFGRALCVHPAEALAPIVATHLQSQEAPNRRFVRRLGFQAYLYYPLLVEDRLLGTLAFASRRREAYDSADLEFFQSIARMLAEALERQRLEAELQRHATQLESLVQERTARLRESVQELEGFSYSLTHDLRAPLRSMRSFAGFLQEECAERLPPEGRDYLHRIQESAQRLDQLITDSLNYSRIVREELPLRPVHLGPLLRGMLGTYPNLQPPAASIAVAFADVLVLGNESALTQCFSNLLSNAVKFVAPGVQPRIRIWAQEAGPEAAPAAGGAPPAGFVRVWVEDNGIGIPAELKGKIFGMFHRLHNQQAYPGTGIGLTIVRKAVQRMGGRVGLESAPGQGSRFWVELKSATAQPAPARAAGAESAGTPRTP